MLPTYHVTNIEYYFYVKQDYVTTHKDEFQCSPLLDARFYFVGQLEGCHAYNSGLLAYPSPETIIKNNLSRRAKPVGENVSCHASNVVTSLGFHTGFFPTGLQS